MDVLTRDHIDLSTNYTLEWAVLPLLLSRRESLHFGQYAFPVPSRVGGWVGLVREMSSHQYAPQGPWSAVGLNPIKLSTHRNCRPTCDLFVCEAGPDDHGLSGALWHASDCGPLVTFRRQQIFSLEILLLGTFLLGNNALNFNQVKTPEHERG